MHLELQGTRVPRIGFGTWQITGRACSEAVEDALALGYRHIDTARVYDNEREVGTGLSASGINRDEVWITTKIPYGDLARDRVRAAAEGSLRDLGLDRVDLLLIHWPNPSVQLEETLDAMRELRDEGLVSHLGVSNFPPGLFRHALELAPILTNQVEFHPFLAQDALLRIAGEHESSVTAYAPLAQGEVAHDPVLTEIGEAHGRSAAQVALRWLLDHDRALVVPKAAGHRNRAANLDVNFELDAEERARIDALPKDRREFDPSWAPDWDS
jgi:2,5-diketo-D-gluconate reductase B